MPPKVYITGYGIISALGKGVEENLQALRQGRSGIALPQHLPTQHKHELVTGEVKHSNTELRAFAGQAGKHIRSRTALLGLLAAREALKGAGIPAEELQRAAFINGTSVGGMDISEQHYAAYKAGNSAAKFFLEHDCGSSTEQIAGALGVQGQLSTISTACSSAANAIMQAGRLLQANKYQAVLAGGTDALSLFTLNGFNALKILDADYCKPFDENRKGLNLGEGAAYLLLESEEAVNQRKARVLAELVGWGNANDAYHQTASSPEGKGAHLAMQKALQVSGKKAAVVDYVNAHGTGTANNDLSESMAMLGLFGQAVPPYSSTKAYTGHTLGAAGGIEAVFSVLAIQHGLMYPNLNLAQPMDVLKQSPLQELKERASVKCVLSNSFGFGGNCTSLLFSA